MGNAKPEGAPSIPSLILRLDEAPSDFSPLALAYLAWGLLWVPDPWRKQHHFQRQVGSSWRQQAAPAALRDLPFTQELYSDKFSELHALAQYAVERASFEWKELWANGNIERLERFTTAEDGLPGDFDFIVWIELLLRVEEVVEFFRGSNSDVWGALQSAHWTSGGGDGLALIAHLNAFGSSAFDGHCDQFRPLRVFAAERDFEERSDELVRLRQFAPLVFAKFIEVIQSPAFEPRFKSFFSALAKELELTDDQLFDGFWRASQGTSNAEGDEYLSMIAAKLGQVFDFLKEFDDEPFTLTNSLSLWVSKIEGGLTWPIGPEYEAKANSERLKMIADRKQSGVGHVDEAAAKPAI